MKGPPRPPEDTAPQPPGELTAKRLGATVKLAWQRPTRSLDGASLPDLARFVVEREEADGDFGVLGGIDVLDAERIRPKKHFAFVDANPRDGPTLYRVRAVTKDGQSTAAIAVVQPPADPVEQAARETTPR